MVLLQALQEFSVLAGETFRPGSVSIPPSVAEKVV